MGEIPGPVELKPKRPPGKIGIAGKGDLLTSLGKLDPKLQKTPGVIQEAAETAIRAGDPASKSVIQKKHEADAKGKGK